MLETPIPQLDVKEGAEPVESFVPAQNRLPAPDEWMRPTEPVESFVPAQNRLPAPDEWMRPKGGQAGIALGLAHLSRNGAFKSLEKLLPQERSGYLSRWLLMTGLLLYLLASGGQRLSQAKHFVWSKISGLLVGCSSLSASALRDWVISLGERAKESIVVQRSNGENETISRLRDYQEESVAQRLERGLIEGEKIYLADYTPRQRGA